MRHPIPQLFLVILFCAGCVSPGRPPVLVAVDPADESGELRSLVVVAVAERYDPSRRHNLEHIRRLVTRALVDSNAYRVIETTQESIPCFSDPAALEFARRAKVSRLVIVRLDSVKVEQNVHHVHRYHDASASGHATLVSVPQDRVLRIVDEHAFTSTRTRYSTREHTQDLVLDRLASKLCKELLWRTERSKEIESHEHE